MAHKTIKLPQLPYGEGTMSIRSDGVTIEYKKSINGKRKSVYGSTPKECMDKMRKLEKELNESIREKKEGLVTLEEEIKVWHKTFKKAGVIIKENTYDREYATLNNQILKYDIAHMQMQAIDSEIIQEHINTLTNENYSYSVIKKTYELLNQFFNYYYAKNPNDNPMTILKKPTKNAMNVQEKEIEYMDEDDIKLFITEASRTHSNGKPVYRLGYGLIGILFTGLRVNEALYLHWNAFDFKEGCFKVLGNRQRVIDHNQPIREDGTHVYKTVYTTTKTSSGMRTIYMTKDAQNAFLSLKKIQNNNKDTDFVFATKSGKPDSERNLRRTLNSIQEKANTKIQNSGLHVLRHTYCSLLCRQGVDEGVVASLLGQEDREMVKRVYRHISEKEKIEAINKIVSFKDIKKIKFTF